MTLEILPCKTLFVALRVTTEHIDEVFLVGDVPDYIFVSLKNFIIEVC